MIMESKHLAARSTLLTFFGSMSHPVAGSRLRAGLTRVVVEGLQLAACCSIASPPSLRWQLRTRSVYARILVVRAPAQPLLQLRPEKAACGGGRWRVHVQMQLRASRGAGALARACICRQILQHFALPMRSWRAQVREWLPEELREGGVAGRNRMVVELKGSTVVSYVFQTAMVRLSRAFAFAPFTRSCTLDCLQAGTPWQPSGLTQGALGRVAWCQAALMRWEKALRRWPEADSVRVCACRAPLATRRSCRRRSCRA
jgi:hypothetical protein